MSNEQARLILWAGPKHSGKTSAATSLVEELRRSGHSVGGFLAPSIYREKTLVGFEILDLQNDRRAGLAERSQKKAGVVGFTFRDRGMQLGKQALQSAVKSPVDLVVVDEFGPLELDGGGWRSDVEMLLRSGPLVLMLVVRDEIVPRFRQLYHAFSPLTIEASHPHAALQVKALLQTDESGKAGP